jgi:hypothetical protein
MFGKLFGGAKRRTMRKSSKKTCPKCHHKPCACKKRSMKKGSPSKTRKGRKNFITHKGDKDYNARGHRQVRRNAPYMKRRGGGSCGNHAQEVPVSGGNPENPLNPLATSHDSSQEGGKRRRSHRRRSHRRRSHKKRSHRRRH